MFLLLFLLISPAFGTSISAKLDLARSTVSEVKDLKILLEDQDRITDSDLLEASVRKMQDLVARTLEVSTDERSGTIDILYEEIDLIQNWTNSASVVSKNIDRYSAEYLKKLPSARKIFQNSLDDLKNSAELAETLLAQQRKDAVESLQEAEEDIRIYMRELDTLKSSVKELDLVGGTSFFESYNERKIEMRQTRQELRELALRSISKGKYFRIILEDLVKSNNSVLFELIQDHGLFSISIKDLLEETPGILQEARQKYELAVKIFDDLKSFILKQKLQLEKNLSGKYSIMANPILRILEHGENLNKTLNVGTTILSYEIDLISKWSSKVFTTAGLNAKALIVISTFFENKLDDLRNINELFLAQPVKIFVESRHEAGYLSPYNRTRQELIQLADRTVSEVRDLEIVLEDLDTGNQNVLFKIFMTRMKDLMIETLGRLSEAGELAIEALDDGTNEDYMSEEKNLIRNWTKDAEAVKRNFDRFPVEYLEKFQSARAIFKNGLVDLKNSVEQFIA